MDRQIVEDINNSEIPDERLKEIFRLLYTNPEVKTLFMRLVSSAPMAEPVPPPPPLPSKPDEPRVFKSSRLAALAEKAAGVSSPHPLLAASASAPEFETIAMRRAAASAPVAGVKKAAAATEGYNGNMCMFIGGHGFELDLAERVTLLDAIVKKYPDLFKSGRKRDEEKIEKLIDYINNRVIISMAMGEPGLSSPMDTGMEEGKFAGFTSSEADLIIITNIIQLFEEVCKEQMGLGCAIDDNMLEIMHYVIRHQLRANFNKYWGPGGESDVTDEPENEWMASMATLIREKKIWLKHKMRAEPERTAGGRVSIPATVNRGYSLVPKTEDEKKFRAREGLHFCMALDSAGRKIVIQSESTGLRISLVQELPNLLSGAAARETILGRLDINNIQAGFGREGFREDVESRGEGGLRMAGRLVRHIDTYLESGTPEYNAVLEIIKKIQSYKSNQVDLSDIVLLGYILKTNLQIYDPTCRPVYRGLEEVPFSEGRVKGTFSVQESQDPFGGDDDFGGSAKKIKKNKKITKKRIMRKNKKSKKTRKHRRYKKQV